MKNQLALFTESREAIIFLDSRLKALTGEVKSNFTEIKRQEIAIKEFTKRTADHERRIDIDIKEIKYLLDCAKDPALLTYAPVVEAEKKPKSFLSKIFGR